MLGRRKSASVIQYTPDCACVTVTGDTKGCFNAVPQHSIVVVTL